MQQWESDHRVEVAGCADVGGTVLAIRIWVACAAVVVSAAAGTVAYQHVTASGDCPAGLAPTTVRPDGSSARWSACANRSGSVMTLTNDGPVILLVAPQVATSLAREPSAAGAATSPDVASQDLATAGRPAPDLQAAGLSSSWLYLGPHESVRATSRSAAAAAAVTITNDYYATVRWTLASAVAGWAAGQNSDVDPGAVLGASRECATRLRLPSSYRQQPPDVAAVVQAVASDRHCVSRLRALAPVEDSTTVAFELTDMATQLARTLPAGGWSEISEEALEILRAQ